ncbi:MAG: sigma-70 family RNA polymerase sigma factor [Desulfovibrio sp.]|uniref:sigma-70 family RNA polymerase sigma factor n=1 Tax=Desulfovibrio sp. 7SRBS1 TaxID=3378064 RepID=UPI003B3F8FC0
MDDMAPEEHDEDVLDLELDDELDAALNDDSLKDSMDDSVDVSLENSIDDTMGTDVDDHDDFVLLPARKGSVAAGDPLQMYLREISRFPILDPDEEKELARRVRDFNDSDAAFRLISSHLRLVVKIAMDFQRRWMQNVLDLIQEGNVGLMRAVQKFDPEKGIKFSYYAAFWIKAYILKFIMDNWRMVKIGTTQAQRKLFYNLNKERQRLQALGYDPTTSALSKSLGVSKEDITEMDQRLSKNDMSLNLTYGEDSNATRMDFLPALGPGIEETLAGDEMSSLLTSHIDTLRPKLNEKELAILDERLLSESPQTLREIGEEYGITRERVRQIEARLLQKLKQHLSNRIQDFSVDWIRKED